MSHRAYVPLKVVLLTIVLAGGTVSAQTLPTTTSRPTTVPADTGKPLRAVVKAVDGVAQRLLPGPKGRWVPLKAGDKLEEGTIIRTGIGTRVVLTFADSTVITINRATKFGIGQFRQVGKVTRARLGIKYGSIRATVEKARGQSDVRITTPVATLAITGTSGDLAYAADTGFRLQCQDGTWTCHVGERVRHVEPTEQTDSSMTRHVEVVKVVATAQLGDSFGGLSEAETLSLINAGDGRGAIGFSGAGTRAGATVQPPRHHGPKKPKKPKKPKRRSSYIRPPKIIRPPIHGDDE